MTVSNVSSSKFVAKTTSTKHPTVRIIYGDQEADVDKQIAPLIKEMWKAGIETYQSCQDNPPGWIWIQFMSSHELEKFLSIIGDYADTLGSLHDRMRHGYDRLAGPRVGQWRYVVVAFDPNKIAPRGFTLAGRSGRNARMQNSLMPSKPPRSAKRSPPR